jgi:hypothetical protein
MRNLVPIKIKIGLKGNGYAKYPDFGSLNCVKSSGLDWSSYVDVQGTGWHYDKRCGHKEEDSTSPFGIQWGVLIIPKVFADEATAMFPGEVVRLTEAELTTFYDTRSHAHEPDEEIDNTILQAIKVKQDLNLPLTPEQESALDPTTETRGIRKNKRKKWIDYKKLKGIKIAQ